MIIVMRQPLMWESIRTFSDTITRNRMNTASRITRSTIRRVTIIIA